MKAAVAVFGAMGVFAFLVIAFGVVINMVAGANLGDTTATAFFDALPIIMGVIILLCGAAFVMLAWGRK